MFGRIRKTDKNTMYVNFVLNQDNPQTLNLDYHFSGDSYKANNIHPENFKSAAKNIEKRINKYHEGCCVLFFDDDEDPTYLNINFSLLKKISKTETKILSNKTNNSVTPHEAIDILRELEEETKNIWSPPQNITVKP